MNFDYPLVFLLLPLPVLVYWFFPARKEAESSLHIPFFQRLVEATGNTPSEVSVVRKKRAVQILMLMLFWLVLLTVLAQPVRYGVIEEKREYGRDLMIAVDLSQSMEQEDFPSLEGKKISRWLALQNLMKSFADNREGDRLGLIAFGSGAYLQVPFTEDPNMFVSLLDQLDTGMAGPATAIGDAIGLSIRSFEESGSKQKMLILVTDGSDNVSRLPAIESAKVAATRNIIIYTIAIGDPETQGDDNQVDVDALKRISELTNGKFYLAINSETLQSILDDLNQIQPSAYDTVSYRPKTLLYPWLLGVMVCLYLLMWTWLNVEALHRKRRRVNNV